MKLLLATLLATLVATFILNTLEAQPAYCSTCGNMSCLDSSGCFSGCACAKDFDAPSGVCVQVQTQP